MSIGRVTTSTLLLLLLSGATAARAGAELVVFRTGRTMSIDSHDIVGESITLRLRRGGEIVCAVSLVDHIAPDAVPRPPGARASVRVPGLIVEAPYRALVADVATRQGVQPRLIHAVIAVESAYHPDAKSPKGAMGLMQLMPETARQYDVRDPYDPRSNVEAGTRHLRHLLDLFELPVALAAYNAGEGAVAAHADIPPYPETQAYVARVLRRLGIAPPAN